MTMHQPSCRGRIALRFASLSRAISLPARSRAPQSRRRRRLRRALAIALTVASTAVPAGHPDQSPMTRQFEQERALVLRTAAAVEDARVTYIAKRYRREPAQVRRVVHATQRAAHRHDLPVSLLLAIVETESSFDAKARSSYGARGLMQVVPRHHPEVMAAIGGAHRLEDAESNVEAGARILSAYVKRSGSLERGLARYSGGARKYAAKVKARQQQLERVGAVAARNVHIAVDADLQASNRAAADRG